VEWEHFVLFDEETTIDDEWCDCCEEERNTLVKLNITADCCEYLPTEPLKQ